jgi:hypothetical protein
MSLYHTVSDEVKTIDSTTFGMKYALSALYLWLLFGYLSSMIGCDLQRWMTRHQGFRHVIGVVAFFLLFTLFSENNNNHILSVIIKTVAVYFVFILMTKSKWYFSIPTLLLLVVDQGLQYQSTYLKKQKKSYETLDKIRGYIDYALMALIICGFVSYGVRQKNTFGDKFSFLKLLFSNKCRL